LDGLQSLDCYGNSLPTVAPPDARTMQNLIVHCGQSVVIWHNSLPTYHDAFKIGLQTRMIVTIILC